MSSTGHEFKLYWPHAARVELVATGDRAVMPLASQGDGWWKVALPLSEGEFRYRFVVDGLYCVPDYAAGEPQYDEDGTLVSVLRLPGAAPPARDRPRKQEKDQRSRGSGG